MRELLKKHGLIDFSAEIEAVSQSCMVGSTSDDPVGIGDSKVGGLPHVRDSFQWPQFREFPLEFIAQLNCAEVNSPILPREGLLLFFFDNRHWGYSRKDEGSVCVVHYPSLTNLSGRQPPTLRRQRLWGLLSDSVYPRVYQEAKLNIAPGVSLPDLERTGLELPHSGFVEGYFEARGEIQDTRFIQIGGFPNPVQTDTMERDIVRLTGRGSAEDWVMIFEIYEDKRTDMRWGDAGRLHFFCHADDLKDANFSNCWMQTQCG